LSYILICQKNKAKTMHRKKIDHPASQKETKSTSSSYLKALLPQNILSTLSSNLKSIIKPVAYLNLLSYLPKGATNNLYFLLEQVSYEASAQSKDLLEKLKSQLATTCATNLTFLDGPQGNYITNYTLNCLGDDYNKVEIGCLSGNDCEMGPFFKWATDFIDDYKESCDNANFLQYYLLAILGIGAIGLVGLSLHKKYSNQDPVATTDNHNNHGNYIPPVLPTHTSSSALTITIPQTSEALPIAAPSIEAQSTSTPRLC
jgi:hypothetical protein